MVASVSAFIEDDFQLPTGGAGGGKYLNPSKLPDGQAYRIRIVSERSVRGWEYWTPDNKPKRLPYGKDLPNYGKPTHAPADIRIGDDGTPDRVKFFWAFVVWDYQGSEIKIFSATQASIHEALLTLIRDEDWGHPTGYDLKITRTGKALETKYAVAPGKASAIPAEAIAALQEHPINLDALLHNGDPFAPAGDAQPVVQFAEIDSRSQAIADLQDMARQVKLDTPAKLKTFLAQHGMKFSSFNELTEAQAREFADIVASALDVPF